MNIRFLEPAQAELDEAIAWYAEQAPTHTPNSSLQAQALYVQRGLHTRRNRCAGVGHCPPTPQAKLLAQQIELTVNLLLLL